MPVDELREFIMRRDYPCVGAKSALAKDQITTYVGRDITSAWNDVALHEALMDFAKGYGDHPTLFRSFAAIFRGPLDLSEGEFETALWTRVQSLTDKDVWLGQSPDESISTDPDNPAFSLSFGGQAFFVVGLHPEASRPARRFQYPTLVFNLHRQFEALRADGRYERMRETILNRDLDLSGSANPMLARHGEISEAAQYSGRKVAADWQCPYHRAPTKRIFG